MKLPKEEAEALRHCVSILAPMHSVSERQTMALHIERRISGQENSLLAFHFFQLAALFYPSDTEKANQLAQQLQTAADAGEFATKIPREQKGAFISDLAVWPQCPPIPRESPLRYWMPFKGSPESEPGLASTAVLVEPSRGDATSIFREMQSLNASELNLAFVGDKSESGLGANNMLEVSARGKTRRIPLSALDLINKRKGTPNGQCGILLGLAGGKKILKSEANTQKMKRLRTVFETHFGIDNNPFEHYVAINGWVPLFKIADKRGAADARAQREAERRTVSLEQMAESGHELSDPSGDDADDWMRKNGHSY